MRRLIHSNADAGIRQWWEELPDGTLLLHTEQNVDDVVEDTKSQYNATNERSRWGEMAKVASIPLSIFYSPEFQAIRKDKAALKRWLNDPDNRAFRTRPGRV